MDTTFIAIAAGIAPAYLCWSLWPSAFLNRRARKAAAFSEAQGWTALGFSLIASVAWLVSGRQAQSIGFSTEQWFGFRLDALSVPLLLLVTFLAAIILRFSRNYLDGDPRQGHFVKWMCFTLGSVSALIVAPSLTQFLAAWIATSLGLHKLLVFFPNRHGTLFSARKKFLLSRTADLCLAIAFIGFYQSGGTQNLQTLLSAFASGAASPPAASLWLIALSALLKSAQFPFHTWLPDTMGTPTPVSALMHAGIINAGGFLMIRFAPLFQNYSAPLFLLIVSGAFTAAFASLVMLSQNSVKRSLAYSTIAQMGFMLMQCGLGAFHLALLHIVAHSLYKAHAFLSSGSTVQAIDNRSISSDTSTGKKWTRAVPVVAAFAIVGSAVWAFSGFDVQSKPGNLVFAAVLIAALIQLLNRATSTSTPFRFLGAAAIVGLYFQLSRGAAWWLSPNAEVVALIHPAFEILLAAAALAFMAFSILLQRTASGHPSASWIRHLYVHATNGFYLNAIANRALKRLRLHPDQA